MAQLPTTKRITQEELQGDADQKIQTMLRPMNLFFESIYSALNKDLTFAENLDAQITRVEFTVPDTYPRKDTWTDVKFAITTKRAPSGYVIGNIIDRDDPTHVFYDEVWASIFIQGGEATIKYLTGVQPCQRITLTILLF